MQSRSRIAYSASRGASQGVQGPPHSEQSATAHETAHNRYERQLSLLISIGAPRLRRSPAGPGLSAMDSKDGAASPQSPHAIRSVEPPVTITSSVGLGLSLSHAGRASAPSSGWLAR
jgi:hypothetical protein